ncbi:MAG: pantetheine-phosphate adenylyltransferase [Planctomycetota bacterium]|nr:MAG: pantetheine-phosphate adenylyltransferase [Planctomycetota bacterium]
MSVAVYPGTFDPLTKGHLDVIERGAKIFEKLIVTVGINTSKTPMFSTQERISMIQKHVHHLRNVEVSCFSSLVVDYAKKVGATAILRGIRTFSDFEYEFQMALMNRNMAKELETVFVMTSMEYSFISSRLIKEILSLGGDISQFVPPLVEEAMRAKIGEIAGQ